jgi:hypothetical protein
MSGRGRKYTFWLHPGEREHAICILKLDGIIERINKGEIKKGSLSKEVAAALYLYFTGMGEDLARLEVSAKSDPAMNKEESLIESNLPEEQFIARQLSLHSGIMMDSADSDNIKSDLIHLTMTLSE